MIFLEKDETGMVLPTMRNRDVIQLLFNTHKDPNKVAEVIGEDYYAWVKSVMFDPRKENVFFNSIEHARQAGKRIRIIESLNQAYQREH